MQELDRYYYQEYRNLLKKTKQARVGQIILSGIQEPTEKKTKQARVGQNILSGIQEPTEEDEAGKSWTDHLIRNTVTY